MNDNECRAPLDVSLQSAFLFKPFSKLASTNASSQFGGSILPAAIGQLNGLLMKIELCPIQRVRLPAAAGHNPNV